MPLYRITLSRPNGPDPDTGEPQDDKTFTTEVRGSTPDKAWANIAPALTAPSLADGFTGTWEELDDDREVVATGDLK